MDKIEIFVGTYEEFMLGFKVEQPNKAEKKYVFRQSLATRDHSGSIRCIVAAKNYVATGASDDRAIIYDIEKRSISHILINHKGTINTLGFGPDAQHLFCGSDDGKISVTRMGSWAIEKEWSTAHKGKAVNSLSIHPTGKLALSIGSDQTLRTWDLLKGRMAYVANLKLKPSLGKIAECVKWSPNGKNFILSGLRAVEVMSVDEAKVVMSVDCKSKPSAVCWINENDFLLGLESGDIVFATLKSDKKISIKASDQRIKGLSVYTEYLASISSSGELCLWEIIKDSSIEKICSTNIDCRPTCITIAENTYEDETDDAAVDNIVVEHDVKRIAKLNQKVSVTVEEEIDDNYGTDRASEILVDSTVTESLSKKSKKKKSKKGLPQETKANDTHEKLCSPTIYSRPTAEVDNIVVEQDVKLVKSNRKVSVTVEEKIHDNDDIEKASEILVDPSVTESVSKKRKKNKSNKSITQNTKANDENVTVESLAIENLASRTSHKKSKKKKRNTSLIVESTTEQPVSKKQKRKSSVN